MDLEKQKIVSLQKGVRLWVLVKNGKICPFLFSSKIAPKQIALNLNLKQYRFKKSNNLHLFSGVSP